MEKKSIMKKITGSREALLAVILILLCLVVTAISPSFLTPKSIIELLKNNAVTLVMSLGMLCVMLVGGIDISIMSTLALSGMSIGMLIEVRTYFQYFPGICNRHCYRCSLRSSCWSGNLQSSGTSDYCNHGLYVCIPCYGISGIPRW